jgi:hypothetical protein
MSYEPDPDQRFVEEQPVVAQRRVARQRVDTYRERVPFDSAIVGIVGLAAMIVGFIAVTRAGVDGPMNQPVVRVLGFTHTATLGAIEIAIGLCLLVCAATRSSAAAVFFGLVLGAAGVVAAVQSDSFRRSLAIQPRLAWIAVGAAALVVLVSLLVPRLESSRTRVEVSGSR